MLPKRFPDREEIAAVRAAAERAEPRRDARRRAARRRARDGAPRDGEAHLPRPRRPLGPDPADREQELEPRPRRHRRRHRAAGALAAWRAVARHEPGRAAGEDPQAAARHLPRVTDVETRYRQRYLDLLMNDESRELAATRTKIVAAVRALPRRRGLPRGRDADPAAALRRRLRRAVRDALERARRRPLPADRGRALPQAADRRRAREGLRAEQGLPQRAHLVQALARVHAGRVVRGVRRLPRHDGAGRGAGRRGRRGGRRRARSPSAATRSTCRRRGSG